jgi:hypothetical protein
MNFEELRQIFQFEVSRYAYAEGERKLKLRKIYREVEAILRETVRQLELGSAGGQFIAYGPLAEKLAENAQKLANESARYQGLLSPEMGRALTTLSIQLNKARDQATARSEALGAELPKWVQELESLKQLLGKIHQL